MKVTGEYEFAAERASVWRALQDPDTLSRTLPGVQRLEVLEPDRYAITLEVGVGSVKGSYDGTFELSDKREGEACRVRASAQGAQGSVETVASMRIDDRDGGGSTVTYEADATLTGPVAGVGQRMLGAASRKTTREFFSALDAHLAGAQPAAATPDGARRSLPGSTDSAAASAEPAAVAPGESDAYSSSARPRPGQIFTVPPKPPRGIDLRSLLIGFALGVIGVAVGHWTFS
jgi:uncharacterized protein